MKLTLRYFASLREALGPGGEIDWPVGEGRAPAIARTSTTAAAPHGPASAAATSGASADAAISFATAGALRAWLRMQSDAHASALAPGRAVRVAVDQTLADDATPLREGAEVAFFPPVTGG